VRYDFARAYILDWKPLTPKENDMHEVWFPPRAGLDLLRAAFLKNLAAYKHTFDKLPIAPIVYVSRELVEGGVRAVPNGIVLVDTLKKLYGSRSVLSFDGHRYSLAQQIEIFRQANIIIGPHGAGLTTLVFSNQTTAVIEFGLDPLMGHFSHLALSLEMDYFLVKEISTWYEDSYPSLTPKQIQIVVDIVKHVVKKRRLFFSPDTNPIPQKQDL